MSYPHGTFNWVDLRAHDMERAKRFYGELFGWTATDEDTQGGPPYATFSLGGKSAAGLGQTSAEMKEQGVVSLWNTYVAVTSAASLERTAVEHGGSVIMPSMTVMSAGMMGFLADPEGAVFATWEADQHQGSEIVNVPGAFCWNELAVRDIDAAKAFYEKIFGWTMVEKHIPDVPTRTMIIKVRDREIGHALQMNADWEGIPAHWKVYFSVADCDDSAASAQSLGGKVLVPPMDIPPGRFSLLQDDQGAMFYIIALKEAAT